MGAAVESGRSDAGVGDPVAVPLTGIVTAGIRWAERNSPTKGSMSEVERRNVSRDLRTGLNVLL